MSNLDTALALAASGLHVFPCSSGGSEAKRPYRSVFWKTDATTDEKKIRSWWQKWPDAVPGVHIGKSKMIAIDLDGELGISDWQDLLAPHPDPGPFTVQSPSGGMHLYFRQREGETRGNSTGGLPKRRVNPANGKREGIDVRGDGGYVIGPGSVMDGGKSYQVISGTLDAAPVLPDWLAEILDAAKHQEEPATPSPAPIQAVTPAASERGRAAGLKALDDDAAELSALSGDRNNTLNAIAFRLGRFVGAGWLVRHEVESRLEQASIANGSFKDHGQKKCRDTIKRAIDEGIAKGPPELRDREEAAPDLSAIAQFVEQNGVLIDAETGEIIEPLPANGARKSVFARLQTIRPAEDWTRPEGLLSHIADWICITARRPNRPLAIAAATAVLSGVCGRHLFGPTSTALNLYIVCLAGTAVGKGRPLSAVGELLTHPVLSPLYTTLKAFSVSALEQIMETPGRVATADEIGANLLQRMSNKKANANEVGMRAILLELWSREMGQVGFSTTARAGGSAKIIESPSLTIFGASTPEAFYESLTSGSVKDGFMNRFLLANAAPRSRARDTEPSQRKPPDFIIDQLLAILPPASGNVDGPSGPFAAHVLPPQTAIPWESQAVRAKANDLEEELLDIMEGLPSEQAALAGRAFEMSIRLATLHAISRAGRSAKVTERDLAWGLGWCCESIDAMIEGAKEHMADNEHQEAYNRVLGLIREKGIISHSEIINRLKGKVNAAMLNSIVELLLKGGEIMMEKPKPGEQGGRPGKRYIKA